VAVGVWGGLGERGGGEGEDISMLSKKGVGFVEKGACVKGVLNVSTVKKIHVFLKKGCEFQKSLLKGE